jgi:hypothetical protein
VDGATRSKKGFGLNSRAKAQSRQGAKERHDMMSSKATLLQSTARQIIKVIGGPENAEH